MNKITADIKKTTIHTPRKLLSGLDATIYTFFGRFHSRKSIVKNFARRSEKIVERAEKNSNISAEELSLKIIQFQSIFRKRSNSNDNSVDEALSLLSIVSTRSLGLSPYRAQITGSLGLLHNSIIEMSTGEGKTLTAALTATIWGWSGLPCHIITVNDYLAERDANKLRPFYSYCGLTVGFIRGEMSVEDRRREYNCDITYTTSKEIVADFLRDRIILGPLQQADRRHIRELFNPRSSITNQLVMKGICRAIVDEADSVLIDEAVTPLIISKPQINEPFAEAYRNIYRLAENLTPNEDYTIDERQKKIQLNPDLFQKNKNKLKKLPELFRSTARWTELVEQALVAKEFFHKEKQYVIQNKKIVIVDEFTGRLMPQRTWQEGLHQLIEAKEKLTITPPSETLARLSFQRFFRFFYNLAGMTGTGKEGANEFWQIYDKPVISIPPNKPCRRVTQKPRVFINQDDKWSAIVQEITELHALGRPILIGTRSIQSSEYLSKCLKEIKLKHQVLNAVRHKQEAEIIALAGLEKAITVATNMAGRGTDILLNQITEQAGGLHVIACECNESTRIDRQLFGRSARQGQPGSAILYVSLDDEIIVRHLPKKIRHILTVSLTKQIPYACELTVLAIRLAQKNAMNKAFKQRKSILKMDSWLEDSLSFASADIT